MNKLLISGLVALVLLLALGWRRHHRRSGEMLDVHLAMITGMANDGHDAPAPDDDADRL